ncbi:hypothetical protein DL98DRAFT_542189 [Cadophora sp. DSE1049]|nr:hypothetical protein DL98DRAFT_542189 [Cadophora sp. DSE1049]
MTDLPPERRARIRITDLIQKQGAGSYLSDSDDDDEFPPLEQLLANAEGKRNLAKAELSMGEKDSRIQNNSSILFISDDEPDTASQIDNSDIGPDATSEADCNHPFVADRGSKAGQALSPRTTPPSNRPATDCDIDEANKDNWVIHNDQHQPPAGGYRSALFRGSSVSHQARELQRNTKVTTNTTKHVGCEGSDELEDYVFDVFADEVEGDDSDTQPKHGKDSAVSYHNSTPNTKISEVQNAKRAA